MLVRSVKGVCYVYICLQERVLVGGSQLGVGVSLQSWKGCWSHRGTSFQLYWMVISLQQCQPLTSSVRKPLQVETRRWAEARWTADPLWLLEGSIFIGGCYSLESPITSEGTGVAFPLASCLFLLQPYAYFSYVTIFVFVITFCLQAQCFPLNISTGASCIWFLFLFSGKQHGPPCSVCPAKEEKSHLCKPSCLACGQRRCCAPRLLLPAVWELVPNFQGRRWAAAAADRVSMCAGSVAVPPRVSGWSRKSLQQQLSQSHTLLSQRYCMYEINSSSPAERLLPYWGPGWKPSRQQDLFSCASPSSGLAVPALLCEWIGAKFPQPWPVPTPLGEGMPELGGAQLSLPG